MPMRDIESETATGDTPESGREDLSGAGSVTIRLARREESAALAAVIRDAFQTEAAVYGDIPALHETPADLEATFDAGEVVLAAQLDGVLVGTVRGESLADGALMVRRLAVVPDARGRGIARRLILALEAAYPLAPRYELFTGELNAAALGLYGSLGYVQTGSSEIAPGVVLVTLEKPAR